MEFFTISKLLSAVTQPMTWVVGLLALATLTAIRRPKVSRRLLLVSMVCIGLLGFERIPMQLLAPLEAEFTKPDIANPEKYRGVIVLGGATQHPSIFLAHRSVATGEAGERMAEAAALMVRHPDWQLIFSGGEGRLLPTGVTEGLLAREYFNAFGLDESRVILETRSRNTRENAIEVAKLLGDNCDERWLLITSAWHMPRSYEQFMRAGCPATPYPVDFRSADSIGWREYSLVNSLGLWQTALHEWLGKAMYALVF